MSIFKRKETKTEKVVKVLKQAGLGIAGVGAGFGIKIAKDKGLGDKILDKAIEAGKNIFKKKETIEE